MSLEKNKAIIRRWIEEGNKQNLAIMDELFAPDYVDHAFNLRGLESYKQIETMVYKGFPDLHDAIEDIIAEGDKVWVRLKVTGTHRGEWNVPQAITPSSKKITLAPTGKKIKFASVIIYRIIDGKIVEKWGVYDLLDFYKQLGVIEYKELPDEVT